MRRKFAFRWLVIAATVIATGMPPSIFATDAIPRDAGAERLPIRDVVLDAQGSLRGAVNSENGRPVNATEVAAYHGSKLVAVTQTNAKGEFAFNQVRPGVYEIATPRSVAVMRVWNAGTEPPSAQPRTLLVEGKSVVRAQEWAVWRRVLILGGVIATSGVVGGVIGYNIKDDAS